jgi:serine/threonine-protein kinase HipA
VCTGLALNISETDNSLEIDLALSIIDYFRLSKTKAMNIVDLIKKSTKRWRIVAKEIGLVRAEQDRMMVVFE